MIYYRRYLGSYLRKTSRLSMLEHGAYGLLLDYYYAEETPIPLELDDVYRMVRALLPEERRAVVKVLSLYFEKRDDGYHNARADEEIAATAAVRENGKLGGRPRKTEVETKDITEVETKEETKEITEQGTCGVSRNNHPTTDNRQPTEDNRHPTGNQPASAGLPDILPSNIPYKEIVSLHNAIMDRLPKVKVLNNDRRRLIRSAWQASKGWQKLEFWKAYFEECSEDDFLNGTGPYRGEHANWMPTFDYLMRPKVVTRTYEKAMHRIEAAA